MDFHQRLRGDSHIIHKQRGWLISERVGGDANFQTVVHHTSEKELWARGHRRSTVRPARPEHVPHRDAGTHATSPAPIDRLEKQPLLQKPDDIWASPAPLVRHLTPDHQTA